MLKQTLKILLLTVIFGASIAPYEADAAIIKLPKTGQTGCWNINGTPVTCTGTGQDGDKLMGVAPPVPRFTINKLADGITEDGTVTDNLTGLIWLKNANCFGLQDWPTALTSSNTLASGSCGLKDASVASDWRLPNRKELQSLIDRQNVNPALPTGHPFSGFPTSYYWTYWSSSSVVDTVISLGAWVVYMNDGFVSSTSKSFVSNYVWPVRGGQSGALGSLTLSPTSKDYGPVVTNTTSASQTFTLTNTGTGNLFVSAISLTGADNGMFTLSVGDGTAGTCGATPTIAAAASCTVSATFTPTSAGAKSTTLRIASDDPVNPTKNSALSGTGALPTYTIGTSVVGGNGTITCDSPIVSGGTSTCTVSGITVGYLLATFTDNTVDKLASVAANIYRVTNVTADHSIAGTFALVVAQIGSTPYTMLSTAYFAAQTGDTIKLVTGNLPDVGLNINAALANGKIVTIEGGYNSDFSVKSSSFTYLNGPLVLSSGTVKVNGLAIR